MRATLTLRALLNLVRFAIGIVDGSRRHEEPEQAPAIDRCAGCARVAANLPRIKQRQRLLRVPRFTLPGGLPPVPGPAPGIALVAVTVVNIAVVGHYLSPPGMEPTSVLYASPQRSDDSAGKERDLTSIETLADATDRALADGRLTDQEAATLSRQWQELALTDQSIESLIQEMSIQEQFGALAEMARLQKQIAAADDGTSEQIGVLLTACNALASALRGAMWSGDGSPDGESPADRGGDELGDAPANSAPNPDSDDPPGPEGQGPHGSYGIAPAPGNDGNGNGNNGNGGGNGDD